MMSIVFNLNWLAIITATIAYSGMWHRQFAFGKRWEAAIGFTRSENWKETSLYYIVPLLACFTTTIVIALLQELIQISFVKSALTL